MGTIKSVKIQIAYIGVCPGCGKQYITTDNKDAVLQCQTCDIKFQQLKMV